jgi:phosphatidate cytidylyltransferase
MLKQRIITALLLLPAVYFLIFSLRLEIFVAVILVIAYLMALEWAKLAGFSKPTHSSYFALAVSAINLSIWYFSERVEVWPSISWPNYFHLDLPLVILLISLVAIFVAVMIVLTFSTNNSWWQAKLSKSLLGIILLPAFFISFVSIRNVGYSAGNDVYGGTLLLYMLLLIWAADIGAYFSGKAFGKTKLTQVSPNKTWEGAIGGLILSCTVGWFGISVLDLNVDNKLLFITVIVFLAIISVFGDLFESALKRAANIKDSGNLLPGHGGLLDRLDSTITVAPVFYLTFSYFEWFNG